MRIVFTGAGPVTLMAAERLIKQGHEVIIIELDKDKIEALSDKLDCGFLQGDAGKPAVLSQADPATCDFLFCLTDNDQANIITGLLGRSMGFKRVVTSIEDAELENLCQEIGLEDTIIPSRTMSHHLIDMVRGLDNIELSTLLKKNARLFSFTVGKKDDVKINELDLPEKARVIYFYRGDDFHFVEEETRLKKDDEVVILTHSQHIRNLKERWYPENLNDE